MASGEAISARIELRSALHTVKLKARNKYQHPEQKHDVNLGRFVSAKYAMQAVWYLARDIIII